MSPIQVKKHHTLTGHKDSLYVLCAYDESRFFSAGGDGMVVLWDLQAPEVGKMIVKVPASIYALSYSNRQDKLVVGQNFSGIHVVDVESKKEIGSVALTKAAIFDVQSTDQYIYVATGDGEVFKLDWELKVHQKARLSGEHARSLAIHEERNELAVGYSDSMIRILALDDLQVKQEISAHDKSVFTLQYHPQMPILMSGSRDARFKLWDIDNGYNFVEEVVGHMYTINHIAFEPSGDHFVTCSMDKSIKVWDANEFRLLKVIDKARHAGHGTSVNKLLWMQYHNWLVSCSDDRTISIWEVTNTH
ncbi:WD40 repeat domain-containing protein [Marinoscillum furvescens]|uniref:WD-40 repeat-containing protein n=1 Tax=Marinoscillum furvescens DSM 4134 TaxID=1122208 RepID=A0A3D9KWJ2_MARFU|nr:WD40 repeat domain-containing protein [Marinoscillum furvescens]RED92643.1 WD-40 repeat-containing protein [Marinoscillum furvescens DSM 4134]